MYITKSLYKEFLFFPKLAFWHINDKAIYKAINDDIYGSMNGAEIGQSVEDLVMTLWQDKIIKEVVLKNYYNFHSNYDSESRKILNELPDILYQAGFIYKDLFIKADFLVKNEEGKYDLIEVKSVNSAIEGTEELSLKSDLKDDVSFQRYVLKRAMGNLFSGRCFIYHLNKEFIKNGEVNSKDLIKTVDVTDYLSLDEELEGFVEQMRKRLSLSIDEFDKQYPFEGKEYFSYYGKEPEKGSIYSFGKLTSSTAKLQVLLCKGKHFIDDIEEKDLEVFGSVEDESGFEKFIRLYKKGEVVDKEAIKAIMDNLKFPLFFYDYETVGGPVPIFDGTSPWQQVVVQYSLHKMTEDGEIIHYENIVNFGEQINKRIVDGLVKDIGNTDGTFIVWNKSFENSRNNEIGKIYPEHKDFFERVNANTFDLMDIFRKQLYFHKDFKGSASIKKVLPVLTNISYDDLEVGNGGVATGLLHDIVVGKIDKGIYEQTRTNLLKYCKQDTWAMVEIYSKILDKINN